MKKTLAMLPILLILAAVVSSGQPAAVSAQPDVSVPPGATVVTEINLTDNDVLGMIKQAIPAFAQSASGAKGELGEMLKNVDLNELVTAIQDVKVVHALQFKLTSSTTSASVINYYQSLFTSDAGWSRVLYDTSMVQSGAVAVYSKDGQEFAAVGTDPTRKSAYIVRTVGFVNVPKLAAWFGKSAKYFSDLEAKQKASAAAKKPLKPAVRKPATKARRK